MKKSLYSINRKWLLIPIFISVAIFFIGVLFKIMHWPFASELLFSGIIGIVFFNLLYFFTKKSKVLFDYLKFSLLILFCLMMSFRLFKRRIIYQKGFSNIEFYLFISLLILAIVLGVIYFFKLDKNGKRFFTWKWMKTNGLYVSGFIFIITGSLFKIFHFPFAGPLLIAGMLVLVIEVVKKQTV